MEVPSENQSASILSQMLQKITGDEQES